MFMKKLFLLSVILANLLAVRAQETLLFDFDTQLPGGNWPWDKWGGVSSIEVVDNPDISGDKVAKITCVTVAGQQPGFFMIMPELQSSDDFAGFSMKIKSDFNQLRFTFTIEDGSGQKGNWTTFPVYTANGNWQTIDFPFIPAMKNFNFNKITLNATCWEPLTLPATFTYYIDDVTLVNDYKIAAGETKTGAIYRSGTYKNIIFTADEEGNVGKLQLTGQAEPLPVNGVVKFKKTFPEGKWYTIGFPFDIDSVYCADYEEGRPLQYFKTGETNSDYSLKTYDIENGYFHHYDQSTTDPDRYKIAAGGYVIQPLNSLEGKELTFVSAGAPILTNSNVVSLNAEYALLANPAVTEINHINGAGLHRYYDFETGGETDFELLPGDIARGLKPFDAIIVKKGDEASFLTINDIDTDMPTGIDAITGKENADNRVIKTHYYTLQGTEIRQPVAGGIYIVKKIYASQKTEVKKYSANGF
jgi:hypothetical protein